MMTYATVTGRIVVPGTDDGIPGQLHAIPMTNGEILAFPDDDTLTLGPAVAEVAADGTLTQDGTPGLKVPADVPAGTVWQLKFHPEGRRKLPVNLGVYEITADTTTGDLVAVTPVAISPTVASNIEAAAALGATNDTATASFVTDVGSATHAALSATIGAEVADRALTTPHALAARNYGVQNYTHSAGEVVAPFVAAPPSDVETMATFASMDGWIADGGTVTADGDGIKIAIPTAGGFGRINRTLTPSVTFGTAPTILLEVTPHDSNTASLQIHMASAGFTTDYVWQSIDISSFAPGERRVVAVPAAAWIVVGSESWTNTMTEVRVRATAKTGLTSAGVTFHGLMEWTPSTFDPAAGWTAEGILSIVPDGLRVASSTVGGFGRITRTISTDFGGKAPTLRLDVTPHDENIASIQVYLASGGFASNYIWHTSDFPPYGVGERRTISIPLDDWTVVGTESWANTMTGIRVRVTGKPGVTTAGVTFHDALTWGHDVEPKVVITFDDAHPSVYTNAYPIMRRRGIPGVVYLNGSTIGASGTMSLDQLTELYEAGWDIASHGYAHLNYTGMSVAAIQADMEANRDWLIANGFTRTADHFATPHTVYTPEVRQAAKNAGIKTLRLGQTAHTDPAADLLAIPSLYVLNTTTLATVKGWLDQTWQGRGTAILLMHVIKTPASDTYDWPDADFTALVDYIYNNVREDSVVTTSRWHSYLNRRA